MMRKGILVGLLCLTACWQDKPVVNGYVEGDYLYMAPTSAGLLESLAVDRGREVAKGTPLFSIDTVALKASLSSAEAELAKAKALYASSKSEYMRLKTLAPSQAVSQTEIEAKKAAMGSAEATIRMAEQSIIQFKQQISQAAPVAPADGRVEDVFYRSGEYVQAGSAVLSFLPPENIKVRFFVPQGQLPAYPLGAPLLIRCDGCGQQIKASVSFIASQSEYTPPVIYSVGSREKLVFMVEAKPDKADPVLRPGLPVDIELTKP